MCFIMTSHDWQVEQEKAANDRIRLEQRSDDLENKARALGQERVDLQVGFSYYF